MSIVIITGLEGTGKTYTAAALRNHALCHGKSALIIDGANLNLSTKNLLEVIIDGEELKFGQALTDIKWKKEPQILVVGENGIRRLEEIEKALPGFRDKFGPVFTVTTGVGS